ncbi:hypothetical protein FM102_05440 [Corynebacterium glutamicum]|nr:hypothetical protein FM102_05440 [Corynebacterium glutamicum]
MSFTPPESSLSVDPFSFGTFTLWNADPRRCAVSLELFTRKGISFDLQFF